MQQTLSLDEIKSLLAGPLARVHEAYRRRLHSQVALMQEVNDYLAARSGKELRTLLVLLSACAVSGSEAAIGDSTVLHAAAVEMLHNASLIHDDVIDQAQQRRGVETISSVWSNHVAVLVGDFFVTGALRCAVKAGDSRVLESLAQMGGDLSLGEINQYDNARSRNIDEDEHTLLRSEMHDGRDCWVVESVPVDKHEIYSRRVSWIDKEMLTGVRVEYYDKLNALHRVLTISGITKIEGYWTRSHMEMENVQTKHKTIIDLKNQKYDIKLDRNLFTVAKLESGL